MELVLIKSMCGLYALIPSRKCIRGRNGAHYVADRKYLFGTCYSDTMTTKQDAGDIMRSHCDILVNLVFNHFRIVESSEFNYCVLSGSWESYEYSLTLSIKKCLSLGDLLRQGITFLAEEVMNYRVISPCNVHDLRVTFYGRTDSTYGFTEPSRSKELSTVTTREVSDFLSKLASKITGLRISNSVIHTLDNTDFIRGIIIKAKHPIRYSGELQYQAWITCDVYYRRYYTFYHSFKHLIELYDLLGKEVAPDEEDLSHLGAAAPLQSVCNTGSGRTELHRRQEVLGSEGKLVEGQEKTLGDMQCKSRERVEQPGEVGNQGALIKILRQREEMRLLEQEKLLDKMRQDCKEKNEGLIKKAHELRCRAKALKIKFDKLLCKEQYATQVDNLHMSKTILDIKTKELIERTKELDIKENRLRELEILLRYEESRVFSSSQENEPSTTDTTESSSISHTEPDMPNTESELFSTNVSQLYAQGISSSSEKEDTEKSTSVRK